MDFLRRLFGGRTPHEPAPSAFRRQPGPQGGEDEQAISRYRYLLRTAPPETIEEAHAEAFAQLTPEQRRLVLDGLKRELPEHEQAAGVQYDDDPRSLARMATRTEMRQPGTLERSFGGMGARGMGFGGLMAGNFLSVFAGLLIGSAVAEQFFGDEGADQGAGEGDDAGGADAEADADAGDAGDAGGDFGGDFGGGDFGGGDFGGF